VDAIDLRDLFSDHGLLRFDIVSAAQKPYLPFERDSAMDCRRNYSVVKTYISLGSMDYEFSKRILGEPNSLLSLRRFPRK